MTDELMDRIRAADPAARLDAAPPPEREAVTAARRRRSRRSVARVGVGGGVVALCATIALALAPTGANLGGRPGGHQPLPGVAHVVAEAAQASEQPPGTILRFTSEARWNGDSRSVRTTWVRRGEDGRLLASRTLVREVEGEKLLAGLDDVSFVENGRQVTRVYAPGRGVKTWWGARTVPSIVSRAHELLRRGKAGDRDILLVGEETVGGRRGYLLDITESYAEEEGGEPLPGDRVDMVVDAETYRPLLMRVHSEGRDMRGKPYTYDFSERILTWITLPDTLENRRQLELHGPTG